MNDAVICFLFFILGALVHKLLQSILDIYSSYRLFKYTEVYCISLMIHAESWRHQAIKILEIVYVDADRQEEFQKIKNSIDAKYAGIQQKIIQLIKERVTYKIEYNNLKEAQEYILESLKRFKGEYYGEQGRGDDQDSKGSDSRS